MIAIVLLLLAGGERWPTIAELPCREAVELAEARGTLTSSASRWRPETRTEAALYLSSVRWRACAADAEERDAQHRAEIDARAKAPPIVVERPAPPESGGVSVLAVVGIGAGSLVAGALVGLVVGFVAASR